ncbi:hypothetical protein HJ590_11225 [Naumannella sp. ID2617S]|uniref:Uncharacterized protein n=1 Tax=Enemella dayhoffiae TaxID=2016507 RepID=A0A255HC94_9ACTN|nr:hypothetical protein [Enemella dayhoffiae]NNG20134.1 hypothetical protein [Naumannella sp. ID2617S]OYO25335.1 hypothetical protein CGZ93_02530 [Enemella dayhoffiae]
MRGAEHLPTIRLDHEPLDRGWRPPTPGQREWSASLKFLVVVSVLLLVIGTVWTAGGLAQRGDKVRSYAAGQQIDAGPMTITLNTVEITWTPKSRYREDDFDKWTVVARGSATSKLKESVFLYKVGMLVTARGGRYPADLKFGHTGSVPATSQLDPGLTGVPVTLEGTLPGSWQPTGLLQAGLWEQKYRQEDDQVSVDVKAWGNGRTVLTFWCPVTRLPDEKAN